MSLLNSIREWRMKIFLWVGLPVIAGAGLILGGQDLMPGWDAKNGTGVVGTFTAAKEECRRGRCSFYGTWTATDGSAARPEVILYDKPDSLRLGGTVEALDSGAREGVFATTGGSTYLLNTGFMLGGLAAAIGWLVFLFRTFRRRATVPAERARVATHRGQAG